MSARQLPQIDYLAVRAATRQLVKLCGGGNRAAAITRVGQQELSRYGNPHDDKTVFMPADVVADLEAECGEPVLTKTLAELSGHVLVPVPHATNNLEATLVRRVSDMLAEVSDVSGGVSRALDDGEISVSEARLLHREILEAMGALAALDKELDAATKGKG